jgi:biotin synthase-like enzyme
MAKRRTESLITEAVLCKVLGWNIEFLSGGYGTYKQEELLKILQYIYATYGQKLWLNIGTMNKKMMEPLLPYIEGVSGSVECLNNELHDFVCPSKPLQPIFNTLKEAKSLGLKTGITIIIGLGETISDYAQMRDFIKEYSIDRVTFYRLNPHPGTIYTKGPTTEYYVEWISQTRKDFPELEIIAGSWKDKLDEIHLLLKAGADNITKFQSTGMFGTELAAKIENEVAKAGKTFQGTLTKLPDVDWDAEIDKIDIPEDLKLKVKNKIKSYLKMMSGNIRERQDKKHILQE